VHSIDVLRPAIGGDVVGRLPDGRIVFVRGAAPGDRIQVEITDVKKRFAKGRLVHRMPGDASVPPFCPMFEKCGGCPWQAIPLEAQRASLEVELARRIDRLKRFNVGDVHVGSIKAFATKGWRSTARVHSKGGLVGYKEYRRNQIVDLPSCPVLTPTVDRLLKCLKSSVESLSITAPFQARLTAASNQTSGTITITSKVAHDPLVGLAERLCEQSVVHGVGLDMPGRRLSLGDCSNTMQDGLAVYPAGSFVQAHQDGNQALVDYVVERIGAGSRVLELFCGSGNFTFPLLTAGCSVEAVELDAEAVDRLSRRAVELGLSENLKARVGNADSLDSAVLAETILVDPPRSGFKGAANAADAAQALRFVYVSCDLNTLFRDLESLIVQGWSLVSLEGFDLFPHTGHLETVAYLERSKV